MEEIGTARRRICSKFGWLKLVQGVVVAPRVPTCGQRNIVFFVVSDGLRHAVPVACTIGEGGFYPHRPVRLRLRKKARAAVVRQRKAPRGYEAILPHGPPVKKKQDHGKRGERFGSDYNGVISTVESELCEIEGLEGKEAAMKSGKREGVAYCWKNAMEETTAVNSRTTSMSWVGSRSAIWLRGIANTEDRKTAAYAAWKLLLYEHPGLTMQGLPSRSWRL